MIAVIAVLDLIMEFSLQEVYDFKGELKEGGSDWNGELACSIVSVEVKIIVR